MGKEKTTVTKTRQPKVINLQMNATFFFERAVQSLDRFHYDKALKYFRRAVEYEPNNPVNYFNMAGILSEMGDFAQSNTVLRQILDDLDPGMTECYFYMANNYANMEQFEQAEQALVRYLEEDAAGQYLEESEELMEFLSFELERPTPIKNIKSREELFEHDRARALLEEGHFSEATIALEKLVERKPKFIAARNNLALAYYYRGYFDKCLATISEVLDKDPGNLHALCNLAIVYKHMGNQEGLEHIKGMLLKIVPYQHDHLFKLAKTMGTLDEHHYAYLHFKRLLRWIEPGDPYLYHYTAVAAFNTKRYEEAERYWRLSERYDPESDIPLFYLNQLESWRMKAGDKPTASYHYYLPFEETLKTIDAGTDPLQEYIKKDPLLRSSFLWALRHGDEQTKLQVIKAMGATGEHEMEVALREFLVDPSEEDYLKKVAVLVLRGMGVSEPLQAHINGNQLEIRAEAILHELPVWLDKWQQVMDKAKEHMVKRYDLVQQHDMQTLWVEFLSRTYPNIPRMVKPEAWAAALEYLTAKMHRRSVTYKDVSERYEVAVSTIRKNVERIDQTCGLEEKMKAIFPQFSGKI